MRTAAWPLLAATLLAVLGVLVHIPMLTTAVDVPVMVGEQQFTLRLPDDAHQATLQQGIAEMSAAFQQVSASRPRRREFEWSTTSARIGLGTPPWLGWWMHPALRVGAGGARRGVCAGSNWEGDWVESVGARRTVRPSVGWKLFARNPTGRCSGLCQTSTNQDASWDACIDPYATARFPLSPSLSPHSPEPLGWDDDHEGLRMQRTDEVACG